MLPGISMRLLPFATLLLLALLSPVSADFGFTPLPSSAWSEMTTDPDVLDTRPFMIPAGFSQRILSDETRLDIYRGNDWTDMQVLNETGKDAGRYLYRTHEVRRHNDRLRDGREGGAVSVVDLVSGQTGLFATREDWEAVDGVLWTPWMSLLVTEEQKHDSSPDPHYPDAARGLVYELFPKPGNPEQLAQAVARPLLGSLTHEGIEVDDEGNIYVIDEDDAGSIYRFVPDRFGDLASGRLFVLRVAEGAQTGPAEWVALQLDRKSLDARSAARSKGATSFCRPEDLERIGAMLYAALTCEDGDGAVLSIQLATETPVVRYFVKPGHNVARERSLLRRTGFRHPDNLANGPDGRLWISEDNAPGDIWVADPDSDGDGYSDGVELFASLRDEEGEPTGIYFGGIPARLFVSVQHSSTGNDKTLVIEKAHVQE
ncbi:MAG: DUF839 domain-containing protein [Chromatiales bacterium]|jgi:hypothetical protein